MKLKLILFSASILFSVSGFASPADWQNLVSGNNAFAFELLHQLCHDQPAANIFISPYSASMALQMAAGGADGRTKTEMQSVLGTTGLSSAALGEANNEIARSFNADNPRVTLTTANAMWFRKKTAVSADFIHNTGEYFHASVAPLDFSNPHSVDVINQWAKVQTHGKINQILEGKLDPDDQLFLANAVYFKAKWANPFKVVDTTNQPFYLRAASPVDVPLMTQTRRFSYAQGTNYQAVRLPYDGQNLAMYIFLPGTNSSPEELLSGLGGDDWWRNIKQSFSDHEGTLMLPRFRLEYGVELKAPLQALGMKSAFGASADFSGIAPGLYISSVLQKTYVDVNEEGTEAAAVTGIRVTRLAIEMPSTPFKMIVDHPFLFLIEDNQTGVILFMGMVFDPVEK